MIEEIVDILVPSGKEEAQFTESRFVITNRTMSKAVDSPTLARLETHTLLPVGIPDWQAQKDIHSR